MKHYKSIMLFLTLLSTLVMEGQASTSGNSQVFSFYTQLRDSIETNNTTLVALRAEVEARKLDNLTGITLADPEVGYKHMWEGAEQSGNLTEFTVSQSFDLSTLLGYKVRTADSKNQYIDLEYRMARMDVLLEAHLLCIDINYYRALGAELERRLVHARRVLEVEKQRLDAGDTDFLSYNNVLLSFASLDAEKSHIDAELRVLEADLARLNGGRPLALNYSANSTMVFTNDFDSWYAEAMDSSPMLALAREGCQVAKSELALTKSMHLPTLSATYINERHTVGDRSQGLAVGMSIPLWANKNRVGAARAALQAAELQLVDAEQQLRSQLHLGYERVLGLQKTAILYRQALAEANNTELLQRAMDEGHISVLEYLQGIELYYDYLDRSLSAERDYQSALAELEAWKL